MSTFTKQYTDLLIKQYWEKPKAKAEIEAGAAEYESINDLADALGNAFDIDTAVGVQLDIIGKRVGISRVIPVVLAGYTGQVLTDEDYRKFIKVKIARNSASGYIVSDDHLSINDVIQIAFDGLAYVTNNHDMTLTLHIDSTIDPALVEAYRQLDLLPAPMAVNYKHVVVVPIDSFFGFSDNPMAIGFGDVTDPEIDGGVMAELV